METSRASYHFVLLIQTIDPFYVNNQSFFVTFDVLSFNKISLCKILYLVRYLPSSESLGTLSLPVKQSRPVVHSSVFKIAMKWILPYVILWL